MASLSSDDDDSGAMVGPRAAEMLRQRQLKSEKAEAAKDRQWDQERPLVEGRGLYNELQGSGGHPDGFQDHFNFGDVSNISIEQSFDEKLRNQHGRDTAAFGENGITENLVANSAGGGEDL